MAENEKIINLKIDQAAMYVGLVEMACLMFALTILVIKVCQKKSFSYIVTLICCFIVSDISVSFLSVAFYLE